jgi:bacteriocin-like protein
MRVLDTQELNQVYGGSLCGIVRKVVTIKRGLLFGSCKPGKGHGGSSSGGRGKGGSSGGRGGKKRCGGSS